MNKLCLSFKIRRLVLLTGFSNLMLSVGCSNRMTGSLYTSTPGRTPLGEQRSAPEMAPCDDAYRPMRIVFVIDNTESNGAKKGVVGTGQNGTDEVKSFSNKPHLLNTPEMKALADEKLYTNRQIAVYQSIVKLQKAAEAATAKNPNFEGIDVGVAHFPASASEISKAVFHHGESTGLPDPMTQLSNIKANADWKHKIWEMMSFTHSSAGITPYATAFNAAKELLMSPENQKPNDTRPMFMMFLTDGLPTDPDPDDIIVARKALGGQTTVKLLSIYRQNENDLEQNKAARETLNKLYSVNKYGKEFSNFEDYWNVMKKIPKSTEVSDSYTLIDTERISESLLSHVDQILSCNQN